MHSNYDKQPYVTAAGCGNEHCFTGYERIAEKLNKRLQAVKQRNCILAIDCYPGVRINEILEGLIKNIPANLVIYTDDEVFYDNTYVNEKIQDHMTEDRVFGIMTHFSFEHFIDMEKITAVIGKIEETEGIIIVYGVGASLVCTPDIYVYADLARWEIQQRYRSGEIANWKADNFSDDSLKKFKRGYFFEWRTADRHKRNNFDNFDYLLDTNLKGYPKMITAFSYFKGLEAAINSPFRVAPFFDPGVWGGQWMKHKFSLDRNVENYAWAFDCVPEENSLLIKVGDQIIETPSINLTLRHPKELLGEKVYTRYGAEFPIRLDFLDTMGGQNLSLQVHPLTDYIYQNFGIPYTQDESYYILDAGEDAEVYLGVKADIDQVRFIADLKHAETGEISFPADEYINKFPAKKHDHFLIPAGTVHCSGSEAVVLEISTTPYIFTFKLWDWDRLGLDGRPRPVHIEHGQKVIQYDRDTRWTQSNLINQISPVAEGDGWREEKTGLHELEPLETRRHWFSKPVAHDTKGTLNVLNLIEGSECIVESPVNAFKPFIVHYAETFIIPANVGAYIIRPYGASEGKEIATLKVYVRNS